MKLKHAKKNSGFTLVELLVVIAIIAGLAAISSPIIIKQIAKSRATQAISNSRDIFVGLRDYNFKFGRLPAADGDANASLEDVFVKKQIVDEKPFFVKGVSSYAGTTFTEGDGNVTAGNELEDGTNVFTYWATSASEGINITRASANTPILSVPQQATATAVEDAAFYASDFGGQAVILSADGAAVAYQIEEDGATGIGTATDDNAAELKPALIISNGAAAPLVSVLPALGGSASAP